MMGKKKRREDEFHPSLSENPRYAPELVASRLQSRTVGVDKRPQLYSPSSVSDSTTMSCSCVVDVLRTWQLIRLCVAIHDRQTSTTVVVHGDSLTVLQELS